MRLTLSKNRRARHQQRSDLWDLDRQRQGGLFRALKPPQLFVGSFALLVVFGTLGLKLLPGLYTGEPLNWLDALFTATSAVCVTGLIVVDTATYFTTAGQAFLLLLIQLGGLGVIAFTSLIIVALGRRLSLRHQVLAAGAAEALPHVEAHTLVRDVVRFTVVMELVGAGLLYLCWIPRFGWSEAAWPAFFHAISAFCNAGFSTFSDSLVGFQGHAAAQLVVMVLIVVGGLGFLTLEELYLWRGARRKQQHFRLSLHSSVVLAVTGVLLVGGWVFFTFFEWNVTFREMGVGGKLLNGLFASVTARTAGFNTIDYGVATDSTCFLTILLMFVGGSPGSTAGGVKTTTAALIGLLAWSRFRGRSETSLWGRSVPDETVQRAVGLFVAAFGLVTISIFVFTTTELGSVAHDAVAEGFLKYMFEAASAFNTVGLSMGVTGDLTASGRWAAILLMFLGRVGPLTFAAALAVRQREPVGGFRYAYEDVVVG